MSLPNWPALADETIRHLQALIRLDTTNPPGNETLAAEYIADVLRADGLEPLVLASAPGRGNVIARLKGSGERPPLLLYGHTDVVPADCFVLQDCLYQPTNVVNSFRKEHSWTAKLSACFALKMMPA